MLSLVMDRVYQNDFLIFSTNLPGFGFLAAHLYIAPESAPLSKSLLSELVFIHVTLAFLAYALFSLSAVTAVLYLIGCKLLKRKRWNQTLRRLPSLGSLQHFSNRMVMIGVPLLILALVLGGIWANKQIREWFLVRSQDFPARNPRDSCLFDLSVPAGSPWMERTTSRLVEYRLFYHPGDQLLDFQCGLFLSSVVVMIDSIPRPCHVSVSGGPRGSKITTISSNILEAGEKLRTVFHKEERIVRTIVVGTQRSSWRSPRPNG